MSSSTDKFVEIFAGPFLIGSFLNVFLAGLNSMQIMSYFKHLTSHERRIYTWMVAIVGLLSMVFSGFVIILEYSQLVQNYGSPDHLLYIHWGYVMDPIMTAIVAAIVQSFYAYRIYILSQRSIVIPLLVLVLTSTQLGLGFFTSVWAFLHPNWAIVGAHISWAVSTWLFLMAGTDVIITGTIVYYLARRRSGFNATNSIIDNVIRYTVTSNGLTSAAAVTSSLMFQKGPGLWHIIPGTIIIKLYSISFMASLNSRKDLAKEIMTTRNGSMGTNAGGPWGLSANGGGSPKGSSSANGANGNGHARPATSFHRLSPALHKPSLLHFKDSPILNLGGNKSAKTSRDPSVYREHGDTSFPVQVTIDTTSSEYRAEDLEWEAKRHKHQLNVSLHTPTATMNDYTAPPFQIFVAEPDLSQGLEISEKQHRS